MKRTCLLLGVALLLAPAAADAGRAPNRRPAARDPDMKPDKLIVYKTTKDAHGNEVKLNLHVFEPPGYKPADRRAAIVFFFGGGWTGGTPGQFYPHCKYLASRGMVAMSAEYRVRGRHGTTPFECVRDGKSAVRYTRANAARLGIDPSRIAAGGGSAGGHVAACTGTVPGLDEEGEDASVSATPDAMVLFNPVLDCSPRGVAHGLFGDRFKEVSPLHNVRKGAPTTIVFHGTADRTVPFAQAQAFQKAMKDAGNRCEVMPFEGAGHGFFNFGRDGNAAYVKSVRAADEFLASLGFLEGKPTLEPPTTRPAEDK